MLFRILVTGVVMATVFVFAEFFNFAIEVDIARYKERNETYDAVPTNNKKK